MAEKHSILGDKVHVYKRPRSRFWQCSTYLAGKNHRRSTKEESLARAKEVAEDWYLELRGKLRTGELKTEKTFEDAAEQFKREYEVITQGQRNPDYVEGHWRRLRLYLVPFFGQMGLSEITPGVVQEYRIQRIQKAIEERGKAPARGTMHQEIVTLRQTLKTAVRHGWLDYLPDLSEPYRKAPKISHRAWFSPEEYKKLYTATRKCAKNPKRERYRWNCEQLHDFVLFMANTGLRPDEVNRLQFRDVEIVDDEGLGETILVIEVRGKRGVGFCKSTSGAVVPVKGLKSRPRPPWAWPDPDDENSLDGRHAQAGDPDEWPLPDPTELVFPKTHRSIFNRILEEQDLRFDREGRRRTAYSLRHTYICLRLMEGADIYQIAKNCRTSVEMIEKHYAAHLKTTLDATAINVRKSRSKKRRDKTDDHSSQRDDA